MLNQSWTWFGSSAWNSVVIQMLMRLLILVIAVGWLVTLLAVTGAYGQVQPGGVVENGDLAKRGQAILDAKCASCHATGLTGASPLPKAPAFRALKRKYPLENLSEALAEGIMTGHADMPQFVFSPSDVAAIIAYLDAIGEP